MISYRAYTLAKRSAGRHVNEYKTVLTSPFQMEIIQYNSTCCCKETQSTTGWNQFMFHLHYTGISKVVVVFLPVSTHFIQAYVVWNSPIYCKRASICCANWIALIVEGVYCMTELFWKLLLNEVCVKIILISSSRWWRFLTATSAIEIIKGVLHPKPNHVLHSISKLSTSFCKIMYASYSKVSKKLKNGIKI